MLKLVLYYKLRTVMKWLKHAQGMGKAYAVKVEKFWEREQTKHRNKEGVRKEGERGGGRDDLNAERTIQK